MTDQAPARRFVIGRDLIPFHPIPHSPGGPVGDFCLDQALLHRDNPVAPGLIKPNATGPHRILAFVAVMGGAGGPGNARRFYVRSAQAGQGVLHPAAFGPQLLFVAEVLEIAAAAAAKVRAGRLPPLRRRRLYPEDLPGSGRLHHFCDFYIHCLSPDSAGDKNDGAIQAHDPKAFGGVALHQARVYAVKSQGRLFHRCSFLGG